MRDFGARESRARTPTQGVRQRLRVEVKRLGVTEKFRTDEMRDGSLVIMGLKNTVDITEFEGRLVRQSLAT